MTYIPTATIYGSHRIYPVEPPNQIKGIKKLANGDLECIQKSGNVFVVKKDDEVFQMFSIFTILNN